MESIESEGKTVAEAVENALRKTGLRRDQVEVQILQEASSGFMGLGARPARVRLTEKRWGPEPAQAPPSAPAVARSERERRGNAQRPVEVPARPAEAARVPAKAPAAQETGLDIQAACSQAQALLQEILELMRFPEAAVKAAWDEKQERVRAVVETQEANRLIGKEGRNLEALQFLMTLMMTRRLQAPVAVQVDALGYWEKREGEMLAQAERGIQEVKSTGKSFRLEPMDASMRRLVHRHLAGHPDVVTASEGEGPWRKIVLRPRKD